MINKEESLVSQQMLRAILLTLGRSAFGETEIGKIVGKSEKNRKAYGLCDGTNTQADIVKAAKVDHSNFSKSVAKWVEAGILFRINDGDGDKLLHVRAVNFEDV